MSGAPKNRKQKCIDLSAELYGNERPFVNKHIEELTKVNGGNDIICPICGIKLWEEVDHYIPRALFPEFSSLCYNLIPLCHDCNHKKSDIWLDETKNRLIFNAFVDKVPNDYLVSHMSIVNDMPKIIINQACGIPSIIQSTIERLNLLNKYQREADLLLRKEICKLNNLFSRTSNATLEQWTIKRNEYLYLSNDISFNIVERLAYREIGSSDVFEAWLVNTMTIN